MQNPPDRIAVNSALLVASFMAVLLLSSQTAASLVFYILCLAMLVSLRAWWDVVHCPMVWPIALLLSYLVLTSFWSEGFTVREFFSQLTRGLMTFVFVVAVAECQLRGVMQRWLFTGLAWAGGGVALLCIGIFLAYPPADGRLNGLGQLDTQVVAGLVFGFAALAVLHDLLRGAGSSRWLSGLLLLTLATAVVLTGSRSAVVSLLIGAAALITAHWVTRPTLFVVIMVGLALVIAAGLGLLLLSDEGRGWVLPRGDSFRLYIWGEIWQRLAGSPVWGLGILTPDDVFMGELQFHHAHNLYLSVAYQGGMIGVALLLWLLVRTFRELLRSFSSPDAKFALSVLLMALPAYALDGHELVDKIGDTWFLVWLPVAIALGMRWHSTYR